MMVLRALTGVFLCVILLTGNVLAEDRVLGQDNAPVTIVEYASLTCSHCATFHKNVLPKLKTAYIDTGKVKFIFRDFPLDNVAISGHLVARCVAKEQFFPFIGMLFKTQQKWAFEKNPMKHLKGRSMLGGGLSAKEFESCLKDEALLKAVLEERLAAQKKWDIRSTPTFIFNDGAEKFVGSKSFETFATTIERLLKKS